MSPTEAKEEKRKGYMLCNAYLPSQLHWQETISFAAFFMPIFLEEKNITAHSSVCSFSPRIFLVAVINFEAALPFLFSGIFAVVQFKNKETLKYSQTLI